MCAALVRGINVGGNTKLVMTEFAAVLRGLGLTDVVTVLNSGNAVFSTEQDPAELESVIVEALAAELGVRAGVLVRTADEIGAVARGHPFRDVADNPSRMLALLLSADPTPEQLAGADPRELDAARIALGSRVIYQWCPDGVSRAPDAGAVAARRWGVTVTGRNWNTVTRLGALLGAG